MKSSYKIPVSLKRSTLDHEIPLSVWDVRVPPLPVKVFLYWVVTVFVMFGVVLRSPLSGAPWWSLVLVCLWWLAVAAVLGRRDTTGEFAFQRLPALLSYLQPRNRKVLTRSSSRPLGFIAVVGIADVRKDGMIEFVNGDVGQMYSVVGSASLLLFDSDRADIISRVTRFYEKIEAGASWIQITTKEPQRVFQQVAAVERRNRELEHRSAGLEALMAEQARVLVDQVGGQFDSLHQYILLRSPELEGLRRAHDVLASEVAHSSLYLRRCELLGREATLAVLSPVYRDASPDRSQL